MLIEKIDLCQKKVGYIENKKKNQKKMHKRQKRAWKGESVTLQLDIMRVCVCMRRSAWLSTYTFRSGEENILDKIE